MAKFSNIVCSLGGLAAFYFSCLLRDEEEKQVKLWEKIFMIFIFTETLVFNLMPNVTVTNVKIINAGQFELIQGKLAGFFFLTAILMILLTVKNFFSIRKTKLKVKKIKVYYMLLGVILLLSSILIFLILFPLLFKNYNYAWVPPLFSLAEIALFGYALLSRLFFSPKHMLQKFLAYSSNTAVYIIPLIIAVNICNNNLAFINPTTQILIYSAILLSCFIFNKKSFGFFDKLFNLIIHKSDKNRTEQIKELIKQMPETKAGIDKWLKRLQAMLQIKGAEFAFAQDASFKSFSDYFENDYSKCIVKETLDYKIEKRFGKNGNSRQLAKLKRRMENKSIGIIIPVVNKKGQPEGAVILKDKSIGDNFSYEEIAALRILPERAIRIPFKKDNKHYKKAFITEDALLAVDNKISSLITTLNSPELQKDINYLQLTETALDRLITFIGIFAESMRYKARIIKTAKYPVKLPELFDLTIEELDLNTDIDLDTSKVSFEISDKIKSRNFLLDKNLITQAFEAIGLNALTFNDSMEKELKVKAFIRNKNLIFDFEDNGIGIKKEDFNKIFEPLVSGNRNYLCKDCAIETCVDCRHKIFADGVGLTYAKGIIEAHNGEIFVLKSKPKHTIIRVIIPISADITA
jgi:hypothetical protein